MKALIYEVQDFNVQKISDQVKASDEWLEQVRKGQTTRPGYFFLAVELYSLICSNPARLGEVKPEHLWAKPVHKALDEHGIVEMMQRQTSGHPVLALGAVFSILSRLESFLPKPHIELPDLKELREAYVEAKAQGLDEALEQIKARAAAAKREYDKDAANVAHKINVDQLAVSLDEVAEETQLQVDAFGFLCPPGFEQGTVSWHDAATASQHIAQQLESNRRLQAIIQAAGRIRRQLGGDGSTSDAPGIPGVVDGVTTTGDPSDALAEEFASLVSTPGVFYVDAMNDELQAASTVGQTPKRQGPVVVCLDKSLSMTGANEVWAKGVALNAIRRARESGRDISVIHFDIDCAPAISIPADMEAADFTRAVTRLCNIAPDGGTSFSPALDEAIRVIREDSKMGQADVLFITDGESSLSGDWRAGYLAAKADLGFEVYGILINQSPLFAHLCLLEDIKAEAQRRGSDDVVNYFKESTEELLWLADRGAIVTIDDSGGTPTGAGAFLSDI